MRLAEAVKTEVDAKSARVRLALSHEPVDWQRRPRPHLNASTLQYQHPVGPGIGAVQPALHLWRGMSGLLSRVHPGGVGCP